MAFLGGLDLGTPAERQLLAFRREFELRRNAWDRSGYVYRGGADMCLQVGVFRPGQPFPHEYEHIYKLNGITCYLNALEAAQVDPSVKYCEGYAAVGQGAFISHAWCIAPDNTVLEVTYPSVKTNEQWHTPGLPSLSVLPPDRWGYWGVTFRTELAAAYQDDPGLGFLDRSKREVAEMYERGWTDDQIFGPAGPRQEYPILKVPYDPDRTSL